MSELKTLISDVAALEKQLREKQKELWDALVLDFTDQTGIAVGSIVSHKKKATKITRIGMSGFVYWLCGVEKKKNGEWSAREIHLYGTYSGLENYKDPTRLQQGERV